MKLLHSAGVLASALLLFLIEPMVAKAVLPLYGGSPAVWNTCLLFFQGLLLVGYAYAHFGTRLFGPRGHLIAHVVLLLAPLALLPPHIPTEGPPASAWPVPPLIVALTIAVGAPFLVLSSNSSMVQKWHALRSGESPYFLYAASNVGSFLSLLAYPFLVEPALGLRAQLRAWSFGYAGFVMLALPALIGAWRVAPKVETAPKTRVPTARRIRWMVRAAVPSSLLLAVSLAITTDVASIPLLWVVPLGVYLATLVLAFWPNFPYPRRVLVVLCGSLIAFSLAWLSPGTRVLTLRLGVPLAILLLGSFICHADLARDRPDPEHVTAYYLWIAIGGFAGGVFGNLVAPLLFNSVAEYPLSMAMVALMFSIGDDQGVALSAALRKPTTWLRIGVTVFPFVVWVLVNHKAQVIPDWWDTVLLVLLLASMALWRLPGQFAVAALCVALMSSFGLLYGKATKHMRRSFFGVVRITEVSGRRSLVHGTTLHGAQRIDPFEEEPRAYYQAMSPLSRSAVLQSANANIAVIGLGCGSLAYYGKAGQTMRFYEIDPIIEPLARRWFTFLGHSKAAVDVKLGDARLTLRDTPEHAIDMLLVDAFSSDAIPIHLITVEAMQLYLTKLKSDGFIVMHISNRHLDLVPVVRALAHKLNLSVAHIDYAPDAKIQNGSKVEAVALATSKAPLQKLLDRGWEDLDEGPEVLWTDDRSNLLSVIAE